MLTTARPLMSLLVLLALAACSRTGSPPEIAPADAQPAIAAATPASQSDTAPAAPEGAPLPPVRSVTGMSYSCDGGQHVDVASDIAVVHLADGRIIEIRRDPADSSRFLNEALEFAIAGDRAELAQDEGATARCKAG